MTAALAFFKHHVYTLMWLEIGTNRIMCTLSNRLRLCGCNFVKTCKRFICIFAFNCSKEKYVFSASKHTDFRLFPLWMDTFCIFLQLICFDNDLNQMGPPLSSLSLSGVGTHSYFCFLLYNSICRTFPLTVRVCLCTWAPSKPWCVHVSTLETL